MKNRTLLLAITVVALTLTQTRLFAADEDDDSQGKQKKVPPGLQKKGGLPPGQAKKQAREAAHSTTPAAAPAPAPAATPTTTPPATPTTSKPVEVAKPSTPSAPTTPEPPKTTTPPAPPTPPAVPKTADVAKPEPKVSQEVLARRTNLERHVTDLDTMSQRPEVRERMAVRLYRRLDVPLATLEAEQKANPNVGMGGLVAAHHIAKISKQPTDKILAEHKAGKSWGEIASAHKVVLKDLNERMQEAKEAARDAQRDAQRESAKN